MDARTKTRQSRWGIPPPVKMFTASDLEICKLLAPSIQARYPWGYQYLPSYHFAPLLGRRGNEWTRKRVSTLRGRPHYTALAEQSHNNYRQPIYQLYRGGADALTEAGFPMKLKPRPTSHELLACIIAASIEYGARQNNLPIKLLETSDLPANPDWPVFTLQGRAVFIEADMGTESMHAQVAEKLQRYHKLIDDKIIKRPIILFVTIMPDRCGTFLEELRYHPKHYAEYFATTSIRYDRFLNTIPPLSGWAVTTKYQRAGSEPFRFV
jgi:Replication-relaxation